MDDSLKNLPPKERVQALRELQEEKRRELEELEKERQRELDEAEEQMRESLDDIAEEEQDAEERVNQLREQLDELEAHEQSLEETVAAERTEQMESEDNSYRIPQEQHSGYTPINEIVDDLNRLQYTDNWDRRDQDLYQQRKEELSQTNQYRNTLGEDLVDQLDTAKSIMDRLGYRH